MAEKKEYVGGIWKKTVNTKNGPVEVLSITIDGKRYSAWANSFKKEGEKSPDYRVEVDTYVPKSAPAPVAALPSDEIADDLPF